MAWDSWVSAWSHTLSQVSLCLRLLLDALSDLTFHVLHHRHVRKTLPGLAERSLLWHSAVTLADKIRNKEITSEQLVLSCIERIGEIQPMLNVMVDERFAAALEDARRVDRILASLGPGAEMDEVARDTPFLGVPFSTMEGIRVQGLHHSYGLCSRRNYVSPVDADCVRTLRDAGAIPLCVTNISELAMCWESSNCLYGTSNNPYDATRTPGGSSGGEAGLQSSAGIPLSIGSDAGGSLRIPAAFCGLFSHKPTAGLSSVRGTQIFDYPPGFVSELQTIGPMARSAEDLAPILKVLVGSEEKAKSLKLEEEVYLTQLNFYYLDSGLSSGLVSPVNPEVRQALFRAIDFLEDTYGVNVKPALSSADLARGFGRAGAMFAEARRQEDAHGPDACRQLQDCQGSCWISYEWLRWLVGRSDHTFPSLATASGVRLSQIAGLLAKLLPQRWRSRTITTTTTTPSKHASSTRDRWESDELKRDLADLLGSNGVLLCPAHPTVAPYHFQTYTKTFNFIYAGIFNVLGMPATTVPVGLSREGLPLAIQIVSSPMHDRLSFAVAKALERPFGGWVPPFRQQGQLFY